MSDVMTSDSIQDRLLTFEIGGAMFALPIACVAEVAEPASVACVPMVPLTTGGVINHHGDALPVVRRSILLDVDEASLPEPGQILAIAARPGGAARFGLPVDRVAGLINGIGATVQGTEVVAERRSIDGRVVCVLDAQRLLGRAHEMIESSLGGAAAEPRGG